MSNSKSAPVPGARLVQDILVKWCRNPGVYLELRTKGALNNEHMYAMISTDSARAIAMELLTEAAYEDEQRQAAKEKK